MSADGDALRAPRLLDSIARLARTLLGIARTRIELFATELEEERIRVAQLALIVAGIAFCLQIGVLLLVALFVVLLWESLRWLTLGVFAALFVGAGIAGIAVLRHRLRTRPKLFAGTIGELIKDEDRLGGGGTSGS